MIKGLYIMNQDSFTKVYSPENREQIERHIDIYAPLMSAEEASTAPEILKDAEVIFAGWGAPRMDKDFIEAATSLKAVFYGAGTVKKLVTPEFWERGIKLTSAYAANAVPVAEFTLAQILFSLKKGWKHVEMIRKNISYPAKLHVPGGYKSMVGIISLGMIGKIVARLLKSFDMNIVAYDPFFSESEAKDIGVKLVSLEELFKISDVVSLHTPWLKETEGMIDGKLFTLMKKESTFINTARGAIVNEEAMVEILSERTDITALLDVTYPEPPVEGSPLYTMENIILTPHIAGSMDGECARMGYYMVEELNRYMKDEEFLWNITEEKAKILA